METRPSQFPSLIFLLSLVLSLTSCTATLAKRDQYLYNYQCGNFEQTDATLTKTIDSQIPNGKYTRCNDSVWLLLDRATERFASGRVDEAVDDYNHALDALDYFAQDSSAEQMGQFLLEDGIGAYPGEDYEQILARVYFALALYQQGDRNNAYALLRQCEDVQQRKRENYRNCKMTSHFELVDNPVAKYLLACLAEKSNDHSNANILYKQTGDLLGKGLPKELYPNGSPEKSATVLVIGHNGNAPFKVSETSDASVASAIALEILLQCNRVDPALSSLTGIPVPALMQNLASVPVPMYAETDGCQQPLFPLYNVKEVAAVQLAQKMPIIVARGVARFAMRRSAVAYASKQDRNVGAIVDLAILIANAATKADTRSWGTLPSSIDMLRYDLAPGCHQITVRVANPVCPYYETIDLSLRPDDLCIINIFNIHPGITTIQVPDHFIKTTGESL